MPTPSTLNEGSKPAINDAPGDSKDHKESRRSDHDNEAAAAARDTDVTIRSSGSRLFIIELHTPKRCRAPSAIVKLLEQQGLEILTFKLVAHDHSNRINTHLEAEVKVRDNLDDIIKHLDEIRRALQLIDPNMSRPA